MTGRDLGLMTTLAIFVAAVLLACLATAAAKTERTFYTPGKLRNMRDNLAAHDWARATNGGDTGPPVRSQEASPTGISSRVGMKSERRPMENTASL
jgi:hypothetical protein